LIQPHLARIELHHGAVLFETGAAARRVYFPHSGIISLVVDLAGGETVEAAMIGRDSLVGAASALGSGVFLNKGIVQVPGFASILEAGHLRNAADASASLRGLLVRHEQALFFQAQQSAACNASHALTARLARWLLRSRELSDDDTLHLTQEFLGQMLGVRRTSVSLVANTLQAAGLIAYRRGNIQVTDIQGLKEAACECYGAVKSHYDQIRSGG
jgi:CRP-like cAMP-binding protein